MANRPRGVLHCWASERRRHRAAALGARRQAEDRGHRTAEQETHGTCDDEFVAAATAFIKKQVKAEKPFFVWLNTTHMHLFTHTKKESLGQAGRWQSPYHDTMIDHDKNVGEMLDLHESSGSRTSRRHVLAPTTARTATRGLLAA